MTRNRTNPIQKPAPADAGKSDPGSRAVLLEARAAIARQQFGHAAELLQQGLDCNSHDTELAIQLALALAAAGQLPEAARTLQHAVNIRPDAHQAWLFLGVVLEKMGDRDGALKSAYQAVTRAQNSGEWLSESTTPQDLVSLVVWAVERVRLGRRELFLGSFAELRARFGNAALARMDRALSLYLKEIEVTPLNAYQRPKFLYFPDLPDTAYHDPALQPWSQRLTEAFPEIRAEAIAVLEADRQNLPDFITTADRAGQSAHLAGAADTRRWQAFFFYRHGQRFDENHSRCPVTSSVLESIELCRIADQAPEICYSVLAPNTQIKPHHGVTNTRLVMHLPLLVPANCALNVFGGGEHVWKEGELVMFDDTFLHEAWNRSADTRVVLLMDCWNPHLTSIEQTACARLIEMISSLKVRAPANASAQ